MSGERFGLSAALATPFGADGAIDLSCLVRHAQWCLAEGCARVTLFGTTGEGASIGDDERLAVWRALAAAGIQGDRLVGGVAAATVESALCQAAQAYDHGAHAVLVTPPYYFKGVEDEGVFRWYARLIEKLGGRARDLFLYNIPSVTGVPIGVPLVTRLALAFPGVVTGVKDSSCDWPFTRSLLATHAESLSILVGFEPHLAGAVRLGGAGSICGLANLFPAALLPLATGGQDNPAIDPVVEAIGRLPVIPAVKALIARQTGHAGWSHVRPPLLPVAMDAVARIGALLDDPALAGQSPDTTA